MFGIIICKEFLIFVLFSENIHNQYTYEGDIIGAKTEGNRDRGEIVADITSSFVVLLAIYFPSVTGNVFIHPFLTYNKYDI